MTECRPSRASNGFSSSRLRPLLTGLLVAACTWMAVPGTGTTPLRAQPFISIGSSHLDASGLNAVLQANGAPALPETYLAYGAGGHGTFGRVYLGGGGFKVIGFSASNGTSSTSLTGGGYGFFDLGYVVLDTESWRVYPFASFGGGQYTLTVVQDRGRGSDSVDGILGAPGTSADLTIGTPLVGATLGVEYVIPDVYVRLGLEAGYRYAPGSPGWSSNGLAVEDAPDVQPGGPYVRLTLGGSTGALIIGQVLGGIL